MSVREPLNPPDSSKSYTHHDYLLEFNSFASVHTRHIVPPPGMEAADVVQEATVEVAGALHSFDRDQPFLPWASTILKRVAVNGLRRFGAQKRGGPRTEPLGELDPADGQQDFVREVTSREELSKVLALIKELPDKQREAMTLRCLEGRPYLEIAQAMAVSQESVRKLVERARVRLLNRLGEETLEALSA